MPFQVMNGQRGHIQRGSQRHRNAGADEQRAREAGALRVSDQVHVLQRQAALRQHLARQRQHAAHVVARGQFGHDATVGLMHHDLAVQRLGEQPWRRITFHLNKRNPSLVAGRLETEDAPG